MEFNLSEKIIPANVPIITTADVKEFIRRLKERINNYEDPVMAIDELAGDKLI